MTYFEKQGFTLGREAFASEEEFAKTVLHELHRLATSSVNSTAAVSREVASQETLDAYRFAERAYANGIR